VPEEQVIKEVALLLVDAGFNVKPEHTDLSEIYRFGACWTFLMINILIYLFSSMRWLDCNRTLITLSIITNVFCILLTWYSCVIVETDKLLEKESGYCQKFWELLICDALPWHDILFLYMPYRAGDSGAWLPDITGSVMWPDFCVWVIKIISDN